MVSLYVDPDYDDDDADRCRYAQYVYQYDQKRGVYGQLDWVYPEYNNKTPKDYPYSFSAHYLWRKFEPDDTTVISIYSDRMREANSKKFEIATTNIKWLWTSLSEHSAKTIIDSYYHGQFVCVGYATECNVSNGCPLGIFFVRAKDAPVPTETIDV